MKVSPGIFLSALLEACLCLAILNDFCSFKAFFFFKSVFVTILLLFCLGFLAGRHMGSWLPTGDGTYTPCVGR